MTLCSSPTSLGGSEQGALWAIRYLQLHRVSCQPRYLLDVVVPWGSAQPSAHLLAIEFIRSPSSSYCCRPIFGRCRRCQEGWSTVQGATRCNCYECYRVQQAVTRGNCARVLQGSVTACYRVLREKHRTRSASHMIGHILNEAVQPLVGAGGVPLSEISRLSRRNDIRKIPDRQARNWNHIRRAAQSRWRRGPSPCIGRSFHRGPSWEEQSK